MHRFLVIFLVLCSTAFAKVEERIAIDAEVNGKPVRLVFDTGAECTFIYRHTAKRLNLSVTDPPQCVRLKPGAVLMGRSEECRIAMLNSTMIGRLAVVDVPSFLARQNEDGVLSWNEFRDVILRIDADNKTVTGLAALPRDIDQWTKWNLRADSNLLAFYLPGISKTNGTILIDTGSSLGVELSPELWEEWQKEHPDQPSTLIGRGTPVNPFLVYVECWAKELTIEGFSIHDVPVMQADPGIKYALQNHLATLGLFALTKFDIIVDRKHGAIYTRAHRDSKTAYQYNRLGAVFSPRDMKGQDLIAHVAEKSPAYSAGIRNGDILLSVDNIDVTKWRTAPEILIASWFREPADTELQLSLERNGKRFETIVILKDILSQNNLTKNADPVHSDGRLKNSGNKK